MIAVQNDWIEYAPVPVRRAAVRGGSTCDRRVPVAAVRPAAAQQPVAAPRRSAAHRGVVASRPAPAKGRLRLTRRGRIVLVVLPAVLALSSAFVTVSAPFAQADPTVHRTVVVQSGDTLWGLAERLAPAADPRDVVAELERANRLGGAGIAAGERLVIPGDLGR